MSAAGGDFYAAGCVVRPAIYRQNLGTTAEREGQRR